MLKSFLVGTTILIWSGIGQTTQKAEEASQRISLGADGTLRFERPKVEYVSTGFSATTEARQYPEAVKQILQEGKDSIVLNMKTDVRMTGFLTWRKTEVASLLLVKEGDLLKVRAPQTEIEKKPSLKDDAGFLFYAKID